MKSKKIIIFSSFIVIVFLMIFSISKSFAKEISIDDVLNSKEYSSLSRTVKDFIKDYYEENHILLVTKDNAKDGEPYLNPSYISYLDSKNKKKYDVIPSIVSYKPVIRRTRGVLPSKFDLRSVDGKNYVTPNKNQGNEGLCWAYSTMSLLETHDLITKNNTYDDNALLLSEKQLDYASSIDGILGGNYVASFQRALSSGSYIDTSERFLSERLTAYNSTWDDENKNIIKNNGLLEPNIVFDRSKALFEVEDTVRLSNINDDYTDVDSINTMTTVIKNLVYNNGGVLVSIEASDAFIKNILNGDSLAVRSPQYYNSANEYHALHLIGWDDDYEYGFCSGNNNGNLFVADNAYYNSNHECGSFGSEEESHDYVKVTGHGAWILKNSWGDEHSFVYLPYDSLIVDLFAITGYSDKNWDDSYVFENTNSDYSEQDFEYSLDYYLFNNDKINKIKVAVDYPEDIEIYYSEDGNANNKVYVGNVNFQYAGMKTIDLDSLDLHISNDSKFYTNQPINLTVFVTNSNNDIGAYTLDYYYTINNEKPTSGNKLNINIGTLLRNVGDNNVINYKIKDSNGDYLPNDSYEVSVNKSYYGIVTPLIKLDEEYAKKGNYVLETYKGDQLLFTSSINLGIDFLPIKGSGTNDDPWQIENIRHFNMIKNAPDGNYILMNDLDFEYDTKNANGLFYNNGDGWDSINFEGNFNGNGKTIRNIKTSNGLFEDASVFSDCKYDYCGVHDLNVDNITFENINTYSAGMIEYINVYDTYYADFNNLSVTNVTFNDLPSYMGSIAGSISVGDSSYDMAYTILNINNWYGSDILVKNNFNPIFYSSDEIFIGGLIGYISKYGNMCNLYLNNMKVNANYKLSKNNDKTYYVSDLAGYVETEDNNKFIINNIIGNVKLNYNNMLSVSPNAFVGYMYSDEDGRLTINGSKSTLKYSSNQYINTTNTNSNLKPYEIARLSYNNISYYKDDYYVYLNHEENTSRVRFTDKFNVNENVIPTLKKYPENYSEYYKELTMYVGETKSINDLIKNDTGYRNVGLYGSYICNLDICNNVIDESIITSPNANNSYSFTGLKYGNTTLIIYDELSGYLGLVTINVKSANNEYVLNLDYNYDDIIDSNYKVTFNKPFGELPIPTREGYDFIGWFSDRNDGAQINSDTICNEENDVTIYARWQAKKFTVSFDSNGGSAISSLTFDYGTTIPNESFPTNPTRDAYLFTGWYSDKEATKEFYETKLTGDITLYAGWKRGESSEFINSNINISKGDNNSALISIDKYYINQKYTLYKSTNNKKWSKVGVMNNDSYLVTGLTFGKKTYFRIKVELGKSNKYTNTVNITVKPDKATGLKVVSVGAKNIKVSWDKSRYSGYELQRSTKATSGFKKVTFVTKNSKTSYNNKKLKSAKTYYYRVRTYKVVSGKKVYGGYSDVVSATTGPATPKKPSLKYSNNTMTVNLKSSKTAAYYEVKRSTKKNGKYTTIGTTSELSYNDTLEKSGTYYYKERACNAAGVCSGWSSPASKKVKVVKK